MQGATARRRQVATACTWRHDRRRRDGSGAARWGGAAATRRRGRREGRAVGEGEGAELRVFAAGGGGWRCGRLGKKGERTGEFAEPDSEGKEIANPFGTGLDAVFLVFSDTKLVYRAVGVAIIIR